jgi:hypothetical protein
LIFKTPNLAPGVYSVRLVSPEGEFVFRELIVLGENNSSGEMILGRQVTGFAPNSRLLTESMKSSIRRTLALSPNTVRVTCKGFTSGPVRVPQDQLLANARSKAACSYIATLRPDLSVKALKGKTETRVGADLLKVRIRTFG